MRELHDAASLQRLLTKLGFEARDLPIPPETYEAWGVGPETAAPVARMQVVAGSGHLRVLLVELSAAPRSGWIRSLMAARLRADPAGRELVLVAGPDWSDLAWCTRRIGRLPLAFCKLVMEPQHPRRFDLETLAELRPGPPGESTVAFAFRLEAALDRERVTTRFFRAFKAALETMKSQVQGLGRTRGRAQLVERLCLLTLNRLLFLCFIQRKGWLDGDPAFLPGLFRKCRTRGRRFWEALRVLFFGVLNTPVHARTAEARALGRFPYLNGGLFEPDPAELAHPELRIGEAAFATVFDDLLEKYRFTVSEDPEHGAGVDPEMLGKVFENLMESEARGSSGSFYTPREVVSRMVADSLRSYLEHRASLTPAEAAGLVDDGQTRILTDSGARAALEALETVRVLDPACGSGAFLLGMLTELTRLQAALRTRLGLEVPPAWQLKRRCLHRNLHGVDLEPMAVKLCSLRLWLALVVDQDETDLDRIPPLPNLDHRIRQGDSLLSPFDLAGPAPAAFAGRLAPALAQAASLQDAYEGASGAAKREAAAHLEAQERRLAAGLIDWRLEVLDEKRAGLEGQLRSGSLFGGPLALGEADRRELADLRSRRGQLERMRTALVRDGRQPAFSFDVHYAHVLGNGGFDLVIGNPPWIRLHRIDQVLRPALRARYASFRDAPWRLGARLSGGGTGIAGQIDLSALFLERSMELAAKGGIVSLLVPSKLLGALYGGGLRERLATGWRVLGLEDHSLSRQRMFQADVFPAVISLLREPPAPEDALRVRLLSGRDEWRTFRLRQAELPLVAGDSSSPWLLVPREVRRLVDRMRNAGQPLCERFTPSMGHKTGCNSVHVVEAAHATPDEGCVRIITPGFKKPGPGERPSDYSAVVERGSVRPLVRGAGLAPFVPAVRGGLLCPGPGQRRAARFLVRHGAAPAGAGLPILRGRSGSSPRKGDGGPFVVWKDIARRMSAAVIEGPVDGPAGPGWPVPLNTTSYVTVKDGADGHALAALLNSTPVRALLACLAPRAKDGYQRYFCWTVALVPLPRERGEGWTRLASLSRRLHACAGQDAELLRELDWEAAALYELTGPETAVLSEWLEFTTGRGGGSQERRQQPRGPEAQAIGQ